MNGGMRDGVAFGAGVALSVAVHAWVWWALPGWEIGRMTLRSRAMPVVREMRVEKVETEGVDAGYATPARFRPENPAVFAAVEARQNDLLETWIEAASGESYEAPPPAESAAAEGVGGAGREWDERSRMDDARAFREEVLAVEEKRAAAELAALPRRVMESGKRVKGAPDITLAADAETVAAAAAALAGDGGSGGGGRMWGRSGRSGGLSVWSAKAGPEAAGAEALAAGEASAERAAEAAVAEAVEEAGAAELAAEESRALDEKREDITETAPVEQLLRLETDTWADTAGGWLYFQVAIARAGEEALPVLPKDVLLVLDRSWSINASKFEYFKEACVDFLKTLREGDRFNVMRYSEAAETCFDGWAPATAANLTAAGKYVRETTRGGKTDLYGSLREVLRAERTPGRPVVAILLTDGRATAGVLENSDIISRFSKLNGGGVSVFTVGAGDNVNRFLLDMLGQFNRGGTSYREDRSELPEAVRAVARGVARPVLANLRWRLSSGASAEVFPADLTHLYLDRPLRLTGRCPLEGAKGAVLQVEGESGGKRFDMVFPLDWSEAGRGGEGLRKEWAAQKIYELLHGDLESKNPATQAEIRRLSKEYGVPMP